MSWGTGGHNGRIGYVHTYVEMTMGEGLRKETLRLRRVSRVFNSNMHVIHVMLLNVYFSKSKHSSSYYSAYSQRNSTNASPRLTSSDLGLDPSDPLNLLLHNTSQRSSNASGDFSMEDSSQVGSPPDWSQLSILWPSHLDGTNVTDKGKYSDLMDFGLSSLSMDMEGVHVHRAQCTPL